MLAELEGGAAGRRFSSGMSAAMLIVQTLSPGERVVAPKIMYWGLRKWLVAFCDQWGSGWNCSIPPIPTPLCERSSGRTGEHRTAVGGVALQPDWDVIDITADDTAR